MTWAAALYLDGEQMTDPIPLDGWDVGTIAAPVMSALAGGTVSIALAVHASKLAPVDELTLFDEVA